MANPLLADIYDPETLMALVGEQWLNEARLVRTPAIQRDARPVQGTVFSDIRQVRFQDTSGQALIACAAITPENKSQVKANAPMLWRYSSTQESTTLQEIEAKRINDMRISMAEEIRMASTQYVDDSIVSAAEGVGASLTANQTDESGSGDISLVAINNAKAKSLEKFGSLNAGAIVMHSKVYFDAFALGLVSATTNTFGNDFQNQMVGRGELPESVLGMTPVVTDKLTVPGNYYTYLIGRNAMVLRGGSSPLIETESETDAFCATTKFMVSYGVAVPGVDWTIAGKENVTDTELATNTSWALSTNTNSNDVSVYRLETT